MIKITKARRQGVITSLFTLPFFIFFAGWVMYEGASWLEGFAILGGWFFFFLFMTSYLFQGEVVFAGCIAYAMVEKVWWVPLGGLLLALYLYNASKMTDEDLSLLPEKLDSMFPALGNLIRVMNDPRKSLIFYLVIGILSLIITSILFVARK
jgi:hypothetical protein